MRAAKPGLTVDTDRERNARLLEICTTHPEVRDRVLQILTLLEEDGGGIKRADDAELRSFASYRSRWRHIEPIHSAA